MRAGIALQVLEQQSFPADGSLLVFTFRNPIGNFRNLQNWVRFGADAPEFSGAVEGLDPVPQIVVGQNSSWKDRRLYDAADRNLQSPVANAIYGSSVPNTL